MRLLPLENYAAKADHGTVPAPWRSVLAIPLIAVIATAGLGLPADAAPVGASAHDDSIETPQRPARHKPYRRMAKQTAHVTHVCRRIEIEARKRRLPPGFLVRLIWKESRFDGNAISPKGARGIAQFMPGTAKNRGLDDAFDPKSAIAAAAQYLSELRDEFGNLGLAAAAYNAGEGRARSFAEKGKNLPNETEDYVFSITGFTSDKWKAPEPPQADFTLDETVSLQEACRQLPVRRAPPQPRYAYAHNNQGVKYVQDGDFQRAISHYDRAIQIRPKFAKAFFNRALAHRSLGAYDEAIADYTKAIKLKANYAEAYNNRGVTYHKSKKFDEAVADYSKAIRLNPKYVAALNNRAVAYRAEGNLARALADLTAAIAIAPENAHAFANRGLTYVKLGDRDRAITDFRRAVALKPAHTVALAGLKRLGAVP
jgi:tetratricopeptide (TPR) repeat protein